MNLEEFSFRDFTPRATNIALSIRLPTLKSQNATSSYGGRRYKIKAFTEHGALILANVFKTDKKQ
jgi:hypothetical protein